MPVQFPCVGIDIEALLDTSDRGVCVRTTDGRTIWLPSNHITLLRGRVLLPPWLARKVKRVIT